MEFTGETNIEGKTPEGIWRLGVARYEFAAQYCEGKDVLDIACGTGYGSTILLQQGKAQSVLGVDVDQDAVAYARDHYQLPGLRFEVGDLTGDLSHIKDRFDLIVSLETIEHVHDQRTAVTQYAKLLKPDGILILSTPNRLLNSPGLKAGGQPSNRHHIREFTRREIQSLLSQQFEIKSFFGQCIFPCRCLMLLPLVASTINRNIVKWYLVPGFVNVRPVKFYEEPYYFFPICKLKPAPKRRSFASRAFSRVSRLLYSISRRLIEYILWHQYS